MSVSYFQHNNVVLIMHVIQLPHIIILHKFWGDESHAFFNPATCSMTYMRRCDFLFLPVFSQAQISKYRAVICQLSSNFRTLHKIYKNWHNLQILYKGNLQKQYHLKALILVHSSSH